MVGQDDPGDDREGPLGPRLSHRLAQAPDLAASRSEGRSRRATVKNTVAPVTGWLDRFLARPRPGTPVLDLARGVAGLVRIDYSGTRAVGATRPTCSYVTGGGVSR